MVAWKFGPVCLVAWGLLVVAGCGGSEDAKPGAKEGQSLPTAAIGGAKKTDEEAEDDKDDQEGEPLQMEEPKAGTPEFLVRQATMLQLQPGPKTEDVEKLREHRRERNEKIVALCQEAISLSHDHDSKERVFNMAVRQLMESRLQLALMGDKESIDALYEDSAALFERDPKSSAAAEGAHALVNLAYSHAKVTTADDPRWLLEFAKQSMAFAQNFPTEERRSLPLLYTAARSCEINGLNNEALECYQLIQRGFPKSQYAQKIAGTLRRLKLIGNPPQIGGPTADGDVVTVDDLLGKPVLVVFWSTEAKPFEANLPGLLQTTRSWSKKGMTVVGVNLDSDATVANQYAVKNRIPWTQISFSEPEKRGWNNPIVTYYGITEIPAIWLIDAQGNVLSTSLTADKLDSKLTELLEGTGAAAETPKPREQRRDIRTSISNEEEASTPKPNSKKTSKPAKSDTE